MPVQTEIVVTSFAASDKERWKELWTAYLAFYETTLADEIIESTWQRIINKSGSLRGLGARIRSTGKLVGLTHFLLHESAWNPRPACYLQDLFVDPDQRGTGVGRLLIEAVADKARALECYKVHWLTHQTNTTARRLYDNLAVNEGFIRYDFDYDKYDRAAK